MKKVSLDRVKKILFWRQHKFSPYGTFCIYLTPTPREGPVLYQFFVSAKLKKVWLDWVKKIFFGGNMKIFFQAPFARTFPQHLAKVPSFISASFACTGFFRTLPLTCFFFFLLTLRGQSVYRRFFCWFVLTLRGQSVYRKFFCWFVRFISKSV